MLVTLLISTPGVQADRGAPQDTAVGIVFEDLNANTLRDPDEPGIAGVLVSNGVDVVRTDMTGRYSITVNDFGVVFVIKPRGFSPPVDPIEGLPRFYRLHRPTGSPAWLGFAGVPPTGPLPPSLDFPLLRNDEPNEFAIVVFGDPQPRNLLEVDYLRRDLIEPMRTDGLGDVAAFGVSLGDITFDNLMLFSAQNRVIAKLGIPWFNVIGNHDINTGMPDPLDDETFERVYGPSTYAFFWGDVLFLVVDNISSTGDGWVPTFGTQRLEFVRNVLKHAPDDGLVVAMAHSPLGTTRDLDQMLDALSTGRAGTTTGRRVLFLTAHFHQQFHEFYGPEQNWPGVHHLHHIVHVTACGNWWGGPLDDRGIPVATMSCGAPNGYSLVHFKDRSYAIDYRAASEPASYQMDISFPRRIGVGAFGDQTISVNVFAGNERTKVTASLLPIGPSDDGRPASGGPIRLEQAPEERHVWIGRWAGRRPAPGTYRIAVMAAGDDGRSVSGETRVTVTPETDDR